MTVADHPHTALSWNPASGFASLLLAGFVRAGVRRVVVCPGSRSQAVALAAAQFAKAGLLALSVRVDERDAGFLALGAIQAGGSPVAVVTTSGSAVGQLLPAAMEAAHEGAPLILVTCDRPDELLGIGANQATRQPGIFGPFARKTLRISPNDYADGLGALAAVRVAQAVAGAEGPLQVNIQFRDPLSGLGPDPHRALRAFDAALPKGTRPSNVVSRAVTDIPARSDMIAIAGAQAPQGTAEHCAAAGIPLCAEIVSGQRHGSAAIARYEALLAGHLATQVRRVVVFGRPTLTRGVQAFLRRPEVQVFVADFPGALEHFRPVPEARGASRIRFSGKADPAWLQRWRSASAEFAAQEDVRSVPSQERCRRQLVEAVWAATGPQDAVLFAASTLVRVADRVLEPARRRVFANRGLAGIDGTIATAVGISSVFSGTVRVALGDLAFLHDVGGLWFPEAEALPHVQLVVGDDRGGSIFDRLEVARTSDPKAFSRVMRAPHRADLRAIAAGYGWPAHVVGIGALPAALADGAPGVFVVNLNGTAEGPH